MKPMPERQEPGLFSERASLGQIWNALAQDSGAFGDLNGFRFPPLDKWLESHFRRHKKYGSRDRRDIRDNLFRALRILTTSFERPSQVSPPKLLKQALQKDWNTLTHSLRSVSAGDNRTRDMDSLCLDSGIPDFYAEALDKRQSRSGWAPEELKAFCQRQSEEAPLWIRLNPLRGNPEESIRRLSEEGVSVLEREELACRVSAQGSLYKTDAFRDGLFEIQDYASQLIGASLPLRRGDFVWDACAGAGGKSLQIGARLEGTGSVLCSDVRAHVLEECKRRAKRSGLHNLHFRQHDALQALKLPGAVLKRGGFDVVFVDAPCSSSGTWRRNPEARFRLDDSLLKSFQSTQSAILESVSPWLREGGHLVYATCSWLPQENEERVEAFLGSQQGRGFQLKTATLLAHPEGRSDTMFCAVLEKPAQKPD